MVRNEKSVTAGELARLLNGTLQGDADAIVRGVSVLKDATAESLSWMASVELLPQAIASNAGVLLVPNGCLVPDRTTIQVDDPDLSLCSVLEIFRPEGDAATGIHPSAVVSPEAIVEAASIGPNCYVGQGATIGPRTILHPGVYVGAFTTIGSDCVLWPNVVIREYATLGDRVVIHPNSTIGADGFSYLQREGGHVKIPQIGTVVIEDDVEIGANSAVDRARSGVTRIGRGSKIDNHVQVGHNCDIGAGCLLVSHVAIGGSTTLGDYAFLSGHVGVRDHLRIGTQAKVGGGSSIFSDIPDGATVRGFPATDIRSFHREQAAVRKLPALFKKIRDLTKRLDALEQAGEG